MLTIVFNLTIRTINAETIAPSILFNTITVAADQVSVALVEEGPLTAQETKRLATINEVTEISEETTNIIGAPDTDDDSYLTTDDGSIIAPVLTDVDQISSGRDKVEKYVIQSGDTVSGIAEKFNVSANTILWQNNLTWNSLLRTGQELTILPVDGIMHIVAKGETINQIAKKYQAEVADIIDQNKLADASDIHPGETLVIPGGAKPAQVVIAPKPAKSLPGIIKDIFTPDTAPVDLGTKLLWPILSHRITQYFTFRHTGVDIGDKKANPIYAAESGRVEHAGWNSGGYGNYVIINHGNGLETLYGHASKVLVSVGDVVSRGQIVALVGSTGHSTGPHLHFEVRINGRRVNPLNYLR